MIMAALTHCGRVLPVFLRGRKGKTGSAKVVAMRVRLAHGQWGLQAVGTLPKGTWIGSIALTLGGGYCSATVTMGTRRRGCLAPSRKHMGVLVNSVPCGQAEGNSNCRLSECRTTPKVLDIKTKQEVAHGEPLLLAYGTTRGCEHWSLQRRKRVGGSGRGWRARKAQNHARKGGRFC